MASNSRLPADNETAMKIFVSGHAGLVGSALLRKLRARGQPCVTRSRAALDLTDQAAVRAFFRAEQPDLVIHAAAKVGGIGANAAFPADFIHQNLAMAVNVVHEAHAAGVRRLMFLGSSCIYPRLARQPVPEEDLLSGPLEPTNAPYAVAKIAGLTMCESYNRQHATAFRTVMPTNLYGPGDTFDTEAGHVVPALIRRFHDAVRAGAREVVVWGSGAPLREFLHVDDMADATLFLLDLDDETYARARAPGASHFNIGSGEEVSIGALAQLVAKVTGFSGRIVFDRTRPDGTPRKRLDTRRLSGLGWRSSIPLEAGIAQTYAWFLAQGRGEAGSEENPGPINDACAKF
jgi:GDP-L-fucose synthase